MKKTNLKLLSAILSLLILLSAVLTSCAESETDDDKDDKENGKNSGEIESGTSELSDELPERDFKNEEFIVITSDDTIDYVDVEKGDTGNLIEDTAYMRDLTVEERFNIEIVSNNRGTYDEAFAYVQTQVQAGDSDSIDLVMYHVVSAGGLVINDVLLSWSEVPYVNFDKPWWSSCTVDDLTVNGICYIAIGDYATSAISKTYCMFYDKEVAKNYTHIGNLYEIVDNMEWTYDYMYSTIANIYTDNNGNNQKDEYDFYGLAMDQRSNIDAFLWAFDNPIFSKNAAGELEYTYYRNPDKLTDIIDKVIALCYNAEGVYSDMEHSAGTLMFSSYNALFATGNLHNAIVDLADFENEYGILPYPLYDSNQKEYYTMVDGSHSAMLVTKLPDESQLEKIGIITEALCAETHKQFLPQYYDVALKFKYASSEQDAAMIDLIVNSRKFDFGYVYDGWKGVSFFIEKIVQQGKGQNTIARTYKSTQKSAQRHYQNVLEKFGASNFDFN